MSPSGCFTEVCVRVVVVVGSSAWLDFDVSISGCSVEVCMTVIVVADISHLALLDVVSWPRIIQWLVPKCPSGMRVVVVGRPSQASATLQVSHACIAPSPPFSLYLFE